MNIKLDKNIQKALSTSHVRNLFSKFSSNKDRLQFFCKLLQTRDVSGLNYEEVLQIVRDAAGWAESININDIPDSIRTITEKRDNLDIKRQTYHVYTTPKLK